MAFLVAGAAAHGGAALASALARRGREVELAGAFEHPADAAALEWLGARVRVPTTELGARPQNAALRAAVARASAIVVVGDATDPAYDVDLTLALFDDSVAGPRRPPIVRISALPPWAGAETEGVVVRAGRAALRDFPAGLPEERTAGALAEADLALLAAASTREAPAAVVRSGELVSPGRFSFAPGDLVSRAVLAAALGADEPSDLEPTTTFDLADAWSLAGGVEAVFARIDDLAGGVIHLCGGRTGRATVAEIDGLLERFATAPWPRPVRAGEPRTFLLDDTRSRAAIGDIPAVHARTAVERFRRFALARADALSSLLGARPSGAPAAF